jgi:ATP-dependent DNA helicase RecG
MADLKVLIKQDEVITVMNAFPAKLIIERGQVRTENSNKPHGFGTLNPATFTPFPKNPVIGAFFREIHRADELGSGVRKMMHYGKAYGGADPEMIEGDVFRIVVKVPEFGTIETKGEATNQVTGEVTPEVRKMLTVIQGEMCRVEIQQKLGLTDEKHFRENYQQRAVAMELIEMTIPDKPRSSKQKYRLTRKGRALTTAI